MINPADLTLIEAASALRSGTLTSRILVEAVLNRIAERTQFAALTHMAVDALAQADAADLKLAGGDDPGPFCGLPLAVKDLIDVKGQPSTAGSKP